MAQTAEARPRVVLHFDYDCFYAQVVARRARPPGALDGRCVGVTQKSILATCNYAARRRGVCKLMRIADARRVCPDLVLVPGEDLSPFRDASKALFAALARALAGTGCALERLGLDEIFVDATPLVAANAARIAALPPAEQAAAVFYLRPAVARQQAEDDDDGDDDDGDDDDDDRFTFDARTTAGYVLGDDASTGTGTTPFFHLRLGSHLAAHLRHRLARDGGYTASAGIAANKVLAKLAGKQNKPANQTTLFSSGGGEADDDVDDDDDDDDDEDDVHHSRRARCANNRAMQAFLDALPLRSVPGIGARTTQRLTEQLRTDDGDGDGDEAGSPPPPLTVGDVRTWPGMNARRLDGLLRGRGGTGSGNLPSGARVWQLLHGIDHMPVRPAGGGDPATTTTTTTTPTTAAVRTLAPLPTQISIEDTYEGPRHGWLRPDDRGGDAGAPGPATTAARGSVLVELRKLAASLLRRMHADLLADDDDDNGAGAATRWRAQPRTLRLTLVAAVQQEPQWADETDTDAAATIRRSARSQRTGRISRSTPLPGFVLAGNTDAAAVPAVSDRLARGHLLPLFRALAGEVDRRLRAAGPGAGMGPPAWSVSLLNVCVANMVLMAAPGPGPGPGPDGGDIAALLRRQGGRVESPEKADGPGIVDTANASEDDDADPPDWDAGWDDTAGDSDSSDRVGREACRTCGRVVPPFAQAAHARYHLLGGG